MLINNKKQSISYYTIEKSHNYRHMLKCVQSCKCMSVVYMYMYGYACMSLCAKRTNGCKLEIFI